MVFEMRFRQILIAVLLLINSTTFSQGINMDFEILNGNRITNWKFSPEGDSINEMTISPDSVIRRSGKYSLKLHNYENGAYRSAYQQIAAIYRGKNIVLRGLMKTENVNNGFAGIVLVGTNHGLPLFGDNMSRTPLKGTNDWTPVSIQLPYSEDCDTINFGGVLFGSGTIWLDDLHLEIDGKPIEQAVGTSIYKAESDTVFNTRSGIVIKQTEDNYQALLAIGQIWGFLKYHLPAVSTGEINWDAELFRIIPSILNKSKIKWLNEIEKWVDKLKMPDYCKFCSPDSLKIDFQAKANYGDLFKAGYLSESLQKKLHYIKQNINFYSSYYLDFDRNSGNPIFQHEYRYSNNSFPDDGIRVLALFRYWNAIQYFYPYRYQLGENWNKTLGELLPVFLASKNSTDYMLACLKMICNIKDSHANFAGLNQDYQNYFGRKYPPFTISIVENKMLIDKVATNMDINKKLMHGDIITQINGKSISEYISEMLLFIPGSTIGARMRDLARIAMRGETNDFTISVSRNDSMFNFSIPRFSEIELKFEFSKKQSTDKSYKIVSDDIGFIDAEIYNESELTEIGRLFSNTTGLIIDMRKYPKEFMPYTLGNYIKRERSPFEKSSNTSLNYPGYFRFVRTNQNGGIMTSNYDGNVIVIVNENTQSRGEFITMAFQSAPNVKVLGSTTTGSDGNVSRISLPGNIDTWISGIGIFYPDNSETQGKGVKIDYEISPTIYGFIAGKDELLEKAIEILKKQ